MVLKLPKVGFVHAQQLVTEGHLVKDAGLTCIKVAPCGPRYPRAMGELMNIAKFERFLRRAARLDID
jgi:hypothetical protein